MVFMWPISEKRKDIKDKDIFSGKLQSEKK